MLLVAQWMANVPNTHHRRHVWNLWTALTDKTVCHSQDPSEPYYWSYLQAMRYSTREHGSCTLCLSCVGPNKVPRKAWRRSKGPVFWHYRRPWTYWSVATKCKSSNEHTNFKTHFLQLSAQLWDLPVLLNFTHFWSLITWIISYYLYYRATTATKATWHNYVQINKI